MTTESVSAAFVNAERNEYALKLSEELEFLEALLRNEDLPPSAVDDILVRRDTIRQDLTLLSFARPDDGAEAGIPLPEQARDLYAANVPESSEPSDPEDEDEVTAEDEDHEYSPNRAPIDSPMQRCTVCGQPPEDCEQEP